MVPTKRFWFLIALGIPVAAFAAVSNQLWLILGYNALVIAAAWVTSKMAPSLSGFSVTRRFDPVLSVRVKNRVELMIKNEGAEGIVAQLRDEPPPLFPTTRKQFPVSIDAGRDLTYEYFITPMERGSDYFRGTYLRVQCPLGLVEKQVRLQTEQPVRVYPNVLALREFDLLKQQGRLRELGIRRSRMKGLGTEFESLREYTEGDDYRKIDWKATARKGKIVVRQFEQERNQSVVIVIDTGRRMLSEVNGVTKLDHALDALLMLTHAAAIAGDFIGLLVYSDVVKRYIPPRKGRNQVGIIIEAIHDLMAEPVESDHAAAMSYLASRWKRRSLLVSFTDLDDLSSAKDLITAYGPLAKRHLALLARVSDPKLQEAAYTPIEEVADLYLRSGALMLHSERRTIGSMLTMAGLHTLEAEPQDLAAALVSYYFTVKEQALL